ncbi:hypothetical protein CHLNCDRAFT_138021 [Chlorella variabilis]|uniref:FZ domain-containing protein n=1 Tax=Chlorella variabilis TaxID=554065 RepID=E1Z529_CHLVA|nr:hypothetical protein CHLNCDRAFT_138021 [Chlorella variabilis]EFN59450.1 hypothetical protein CHLNCDRAFT_138021 [Chlorella variabilis]|eukprot:XP_005851552.1 hypothetical protein CHLNCDRAFT_138021 [Chlorella variabilis]
MTRPAVSLLAAALVVFLALTPGWAQMLDATSEEEVIATLKALPGCRDLDVANLQSPPVCQEWSTQAASVACPPECGEFFEKVGAECLVNMGLFINELMGVTIPAEEYTQTEAFSAYPTCAGSDWELAACPDAQNCYAQTLAGLSAQLSVESACATSSSCGMLIAAMGSECLADVSVGLLNRTGLISSFGSAEQAKELL